MTQHVVNKEEVFESEHRRLNKNLEGIAWGLFFVMLGGLSLVPDESVPSGVWSIGIGVIMLGLNAARYYYGIKMSGFTTFLGAVAVISGIAELGGYNSFDGAIFLIILGLYLIVKPWFERRQLFGKVE
jgi:hypothetical protein